MHPKYDIAERLGERDALAKYPPSRSFADPIALEVYLFAYEAYAQNERLDKADQAEKAVFYNINQEISEELYNKFQAFLSENDLYYLGSAKFYHRPSRGEVEYEGD